MSPPEDMYWVTTKSSIESANTISMLGQDRREEQRQEHGSQHLAAAAPRGRAAASSYSGPIDASRPRTITTT